MPVKLDIKDRKILYELDLDARQSAQQIAKKVGLSKDAVNYRIHRFLSQGVIREFRTVLNTLSLGYMHFNTLMRFRNVTDALRKEVIEFCKTHQKIIWCVTCYGNWDLGVSFLAQDLHEYDNFLQEFLHSFGQDIHEKIMFLMIDSPTYTREYFVRGKEGKQFRYKVAQKTEIDMFEQKLLSLLSHHGREESVQIARQLATSVDIVRYRIKKLEGSGIIQGFRAAIDIEKLGYSYFKILLSLNDVTLEREKTLREFCRRHPNIIQFIKYLGQYEIQLEVEIEPEHIYQLIDELRNTFSAIIKTYEVLRLREEKLDYYPLH